MKRFCFALDLKPDPNLIREYEEHHRRVWPEITENLKCAGIERAEIYRTGTRLFMIVETSEDFSLEKLDKADKMNPKVQEWEKLMWKYQQALPGSQPGQKWILMDKIWDL